MCVIDGCWRVLCGLEGQIFLGLIREWLIGKRILPRQGGKRGAGSVATKPEDATWIGPWEEGRRLFDGQSWTVEHTTHNGRPYPITVAVIGKQYDDGRVQRRIVVDVPGDPITTAEARQVIEALTEAVAMADAKAVL